MDAYSLKVLISQKGKKLREIASLTKIMTCYVTIKLLDKKRADKNDKVTISKNAYKMIGTTAKLKTGDTLSLIDLIHGMMLPSGNDAAYAIAEHLGQLLLQDEDETINSSDQQQIFTHRSMKCFVEEMNRMAQVLELSNTKYTNPHGLVNKNNKSTTIDQAKLSALAMRNDLFRQIVGCKYYSCTIKSKSGKEKIMSWKNTNKLLEKKECLGIKTGITSTAGPCLSSFFQLKDKQIVIVVFNAEGKEDRFKESQEIYNFVCDKLNSLEKSNLLGDKSNNNENYIQI